MPFEPNFMTTLVGSFPHLNAEEVCQRLMGVVDIPVWPQLPRRTFRENMYTQYSFGLPGIMLDESKQKAVFNTRGDLSSALEEFYTRYLAEDVDSFALPRDVAQGFYAMLDVLRSVPGGWAKGQVTGPISFGLTVTDQDLRSSLYHEQLADAIVKQLAMNARWQIRQLKAIRPSIIIFVDEPYMASFGSAFISLSREQAITMLDEVFEAIHAEGALAGVHCCGNTDWSVLLSTTVDILNLDAYGYVENLALYPYEVRAFLDRGGIIAWGVVPNNDEIDHITPGDLARRLRDGLELISRKALARSVTLRADELTTRSLIVPSCGLGSTTIDIAERVIDRLIATSEILKRG
jgi:hypothetical protein